MDRFSFWVFQGLSPFPETRLSKTRNTSRLKSHWSVPFMEVVYLLSILKGHFIVVSQDDPHHD